MHGYSNEDAKVFSLFHVSRLYSAFFLFFSFFYSITAIFYMLHKEQGSTKFGEPCTVMQLIIAEHSNDSATKGLLTLLTWIQFC